MARTAKISHNWPMTTTNSEFNDVLLIAFDGVQALDLVGPADAFSKANEHLANGQTKYRLCFASAGSKTILTNSGINIANLKSLSEVTEKPHTVIVSGGGEGAIRSAIETTELIDWLRAANAQNCRIASVCTGAFALGAAGILNGRAATTHWASCHLLRQMWPEIKVQEDAIYTSDHPIYTSAGVTTGIDLCLHLIEIDHGTSTALAVARDLVLFMRRPGTQSQYTPTLRAQSLASSRFSNLLAEISEDPCGDLSVPALADRAGISQRSFVRRFKSETGFTPAQYVQNARLDKVKVLLETTDWPLKRISDRAGFRSLATLHRVFAKHVGANPAEYRARFGSSHQSF